MNHNKTFLIYHVTVAIIAWIEKYSMLFGDLSFIKDRFLNNI